MDKVLWVRPTAEFSAAALLAIVLVVFPMNWFATAVLGIAMIALCVDLIYRKWLANYPRVQFVSSLVVAMAVAVTLWPRIIAGLGGLHTEMPAKAPITSSAPPAIPPPAQPQEQLTPPASTADEPAQPTTVKPQSPKKKKPPQSIAPDQPQSEAAPQQPSIKGDCNQSATGHDIKQQLDCSKHFDGNHQRHLTTRQTAALVGAARGTCGKTLINVVASNSNYEAQVYAADFVNGFKSAGCSADSPNTIPGLRPTIMGVAIAIRPWVASYQEMKINNPDAFSLATDLSAAGIKFILGKAEPEFYPEVSFVLVIGGDDAISLAP